MSKALRVAERVETPSPLAFLPAAVHTEILSFLPLPHKLLHCIRLSHLHHRLLTPLAFRVNHLSLDTLTIPAFFPPQLPPPLLASIRSLSVGFGTPPIPPSQLAALLNAFPFASLHSLSLQLNVSTFTSLLLLIGSSAPSFVHLRRLLLQSDPIERGRMPPPLTLLSLLPRLSSLTLSHYRLSECTLSFLLTLPLHTLSLPLCTYCRGLLPTEISAPLVSLSLPTPDSHHRDLHLNPLLSALPSSLVRLRVSGPLPQFELLSRLPVLRDLDLSYCQFPPLFLSELALYGDAFARLRRLTVAQYNTVVATSPDPDSPSKATRYSLVSASVVSFLRAFHSLHSLELLLPSGSSFTCATAAALVAMPGLATLKLSRGFLHMDAVGEEELEPLMSGSMPVLRCLDFVHLPMDTAAMGVWLRAAPQLHHLSCNRMAVGLGLVLMASALCRELRSLHLTETDVALTEEAFVEAEGYLRSRASAPLAKLSLVSLHLNSQLRVDSVGLYRLVTLLPAVTHFALRSPHLIAHDVNLLSHLLRLRALSLSAGRSLAACLRVYVEGGEGRVYTRKRKEREAGWSTYVDEEEEVEQERWREWSREWSREFVEEEVHSGLDGRAAFFHDLPKQMLLEREREAIVNEAEKQKRLAIAAKVEQRARMLSGHQPPYRPPSLLRSTSS